MASESVAILGKVTSTSSGSKHALWIENDGVLTVAIDRKCIEFPPELAQCQGLNNMIQGLARATKAVIYQAHNDVSQEADFTTQPIESIADAIILLSQLSAAIQHEVDSAAVEKGA